MGKAAIRIILTFILLVFLSIFSSAETMTLPWGSNDGAGYSFDDIYQTTAPSDYQGCFLKIYADDTYGGYTQYGENPECGYCDITTSAKSCNNQTTCEVSISAGETISAVFNGDSSCAGCGWKYNFKKYGYCGDGECGPKAYDQGTCVNGTKQTETCSNCPSDCGACQEAKKANGSQCSSNSQCSSGNCRYVCCQAGKTCCEYNSDCSAGQTCNTSYHYCVTSAPTTYCGDGSCNGSETCSSCAGDCGSCPVTLKSDGATCSSGSQCSSGNCNYVCCEAGKTCCEYNSDCSSGQACNTNLHYCTASSGTKQYCQACSNDNECSSVYCGDFGTGGKKCANPNVDTYCCPDGFYIENFQHGVDCCDYCSDAQGALLTKKCVNHKCVNEKETEETILKSNGESCTSNPECGSGNCNYVCCQAGKKCCNMDLDCVLGENSMPDAVCDNSQYYCVSKEEKYTETAPFWLSVDGLNAVECENDVSLGIIKIKDTKAAAWIKDGSRVMLFIPGGAVKYSAYESDIIIKVNSTEMTENIVVLDEIIHKWLYPSIKEGQTTNVKCQRYKEEYGGDAQKKADEIIEKGPQKEVNCGDGSCNVDAGGGML